jgi:opacity protein-like surface antigen
MIFGIQLIKKLLLAAVLVCLFSAARAQVEVAHISSKDFNATGFGGFLNFAIPIDDANAAIVEGGVYVFSSDDSHEAVAPVLVGYRHLLTDGNDYGFYVEPVAGYTFGATDIQAYDGNTPLYQANGDQLDQKVAGPVGGLGFGYLFQQSGPIRFNISLRYEHTFVTGGYPSLNIIALRISHSFSF